MSDASVAGAGPPAPSPRVVIADDHPVTLAGVRLILQGAGFTVCAEAADADEAVEAAVREQPDVCVLDVYMPGSGVAAAETIACLVPTATVVMLTVSEEDADLFAALRAGASGYLLKGMDPDRLASALWGVLRGEAAVPRTLMTRIVQQFRARGRRRIPLPGGRTVELTEREWEILQLLRDGLSTSSIAARLFLSPVTVRRHIADLVHKLRVRDRAEAIRLFERDA